MCACVRRPALTWFRPYEFSHVQRVWQDFAATWSRPQFPHWLMVGAEERLAFEAWDPDSLAAEMRAKACQVRQALLEG
ncbi:hypothetical protein NXT3_PB00421 (plasmid) [Sinorhizobium fredii]|uniref:Uncharacterized protein n=1 Tax=Rhizobium fredii TaxID=380 RepID=A0A2L0HC82_RHIFR|nr:hypothetical protein NXT3_PB00421 [Sinorhizobium fredii]